VLFMVVLVRIFVFTLSLLVESFAHNWPDNDGHDCVVHDGPCHDSVVHFEPVN
jgi:hypothetical protein